MPHSTTELCILLWSSYYAFFCLCAWYVYMAICLVICACLNKTTEFMMMTFCSTTGHSKIYWLHAFLPNYTKISPIHYIIYLTAHTQRRAGAQAVSPSLPQRRSGFTPRKSMWDLWRTLALVHDFSGYFGSPLSVSFHQAPYAFNHYRRYVISATDNIADFKKKPYMITNLTSVFSLL
jgi:hypothetical protein